MAAKVNKPALFNVRISGQVEAKNVEEAFRRLAAYCDDVAKNGDKAEPVLIEGGIVRITPAEGA